MSREPQKTNPDMMVRVDGVEMRVIDIPDPGVRSLMGVGHYGYVGWRKVINKDGNTERNWPYTVDYCLYAGDQFATEWIEDGRILVCVGCGLDCT